MPNMSFVEGDIYTFKSNKKYDMAICQAGLRHKNKPMQALKIMVEAIGMRLPFYMQELGLHDIDIRMNDKVM
jgi:hypothetical protein